MCGIATLSFGHPRGRNPYPAIRKLVSNLLEELEVRGQDASGVALFQGGERKRCLVLKKPLMPSRMVVRPRFKEILYQIGEDTDHIMLHARATTVGGNEDNQNNHPILVPGYVGIHNGTLENHEKLFRDLRLERTGTVDSELLLRMVQRFSSEGKGDLFRAFREIASRVVGSYTGAVISLRDPRTMYMFKFLRPLVVAYIEHYNLLVTCSEREIFDRALRRAGLSPKVKYYRMQEGVFFRIPAGLPGNMMGHVRWRKFACRAPVGLKKKMRVLN